MLVIEECCMWYTLCSDNIWTHNEVIVSLENVIQLKSKQSHNLCFIIHLCPKLVRTTVKGKQCIPLWLEISCVWRKSTNIKMYDFHVVLLSDQSYLYLEKAIKWVMFGIRKIALVSFFQLCFYTLFATYLSGDMTLWIGCVTFETSCTSSDAENDV